MRCNIFRIAGLASLYLTTQDSSFLRCTCSHLLYKKIEKSINLEGKNNKISYLTQNN